MITNKPLLTLYSRDYCHLCHDMLAALQVLRGEQGNFEIEVVDIDNEPLLLERFDELVPVLVVSEGAELLELCHYFLEPDAVLAYISKRGG